jgi:hypothetical protein
LEFPHQSCLLTIKEFTKSMLTVNILIIHWVRRVFKKTVVDGD